jgi:hypothetical protein
MNVVRDNTYVLPTFEAGACDLGVGKSNSRYGVSGNLVGSMRLSADAH